MVINKLEYAPPTFLTIESMRYSGISFSCGGACTSFLLIRKRKMVQSIKSSRIFVIFEENSHYRNQKRMRNAHQCDHFLNRSNNSYSYVTVRCVICCKHSQAVDDSLIRPCHRTEICLITVEKFLRLHAQRGWNNKTDDLNFTVPLKQDNSSLVKLYT